MCVIESAPVADDLIEALLACIAGPEAVDDLAPVLGGFVVLLAILGDLSQCFESPGSLILGLSQLLIDREGIELIGKSDPPRSRCKPGDRLVVLQGLESKWVGIRIAIFSVRFGQCDTAFTQGLHSELRVQKVSELTIDLTGASCIHHFHLIQRPAPPLTIRRRSFPRCGNRVEDGIPFGIHRSSLAAAPAPPPTSVVHVGIIG